MDHVKIRVLMVSLFVTAFLALVCGVVIGGTMFDRFSYGEPEDDPKIAYCRGVMQSDTYTRALLWRLGLSKMPDEDKSNVERLICGCATTSAAPTPTGRWGKKCDLKTQRIPYCIGHWHAKLRRVLAHGRFSVRVTEGHE